MASLHEAQTVNLTNVFLDDNAAATLANGLRENTTVTRINLLRNRIGDEGVSTLAGALKLNTTVTDINFTSIILKPMVRWRLLTR
jgi:hypothetical protein